jgi:hypothetical protein
LDGLAQDFFLHFPALIANKLSPKWLVSSDIAAEYEKLYDSMYPSSIKFTSIKDHLSPHKTRFRSAVVDKLNNTLANDYFSKDDPDYIVLDPEKITIDPPLPLP